MKDKPQYDIDEFLLAAFFIACSGSAFVWFIAGVIWQNALQIAEGAGLCLIFLGGAVRPKEHLMDCLTFPLSFSSQTGRETPLTVIATWVGCILWFTSLLAAHLTI